jgi:hypothetical protein
VLERKALSRWKLALSLAIVAVGATARADEYTFSPFNLLNVPSPLSNASSVELTGATAGFTFSKYTVSFDWTAGPGDPWSNEAVWALADTPITAPTNFLYADPGNAPNSANSGNPVTLAWSGFLDAPYQGGDPLHFWFGQAYPGSTANWSNITITLSTDVPTPPPATLIFDGSSNVSSLVAGEIQWFKFDYVGGPLVIDTLGSNLSPSNDTEIALYSALGGLIDTNDDIDLFGGNLLSELSFADGDLAPGEYYIAVGAFNSSFSGGFTATSSSSNTGQFLLNINAVAAPEPGTFALLGLGGFCLLAARRRRS